MQDVNRRDEVPNVADPESVSILAEQTGVRWTPRGSTDRAFLLFFFTGILGICRTRNLVDSSSMCVEYLLLSVDDGCSENLVTTAQVGYFSFILWKLRCRTRVKWMARGTGLS